MNYIRILDSNEKELARLSNLINPSIKEQLNGEYTFTFTVIIEELKTDHVHHNNIIEVNNDYFLISKYKKIRTPDNKLLINVFCEHISYALIDKKLNDFIRKNQTAQEMLGNVLVDTNFNIINCSVGGKTDVEITQETNGREVLNHIGSNFNGEFLFDKYDISFLTQIGTNNGIQFRVGKNIKGISKEVDATTTDQYGNVKVTYEVEVLELNELEDFKGLEGFKLGDTITVIDTELGFNVSARIFELEYDPQLKKNTKVVLGNFIENIGTSYVDLKRNSKLVSSRSKIWNKAAAINDNGTISTEILEGEINTNNNAVNGGMGTVTFTENNGILITDQPTEESSTKALRLLGGVLAISNEKDVNGNWVWRSFGTGDGFVADEIISGQILTSLIRIIGNSEIANSFYWDETGLHVYKINADNTVDNDKYIILDNEGLKFTLDGGTTYEISLTFDGGLQIGEHILGDYAKKTDVSTAETNAKGYADTQDSALDTALRAVAQAKADLAKEQAIAHADGIVTAEEQARIQQAQNNLNTATALANAAQNTANSALTKANNSVQQDVLYNKVKITQANGIEVFDNNSVRRVQIGNHSTDHYGLKVIAPDGQTTILDERGILTPIWISDRDFAWGKSNDYTVELKFYVPFPKTDVQELRLSFVIEKSITTNVEVFSNNAGVSLSGSADFGYYLSGGYHSHGAIGGLRKYTPITDINARIFIDGVDRTSELGGTWNMYSSPSNLDVLAYIQENAGWHTIKFIGDDGFLVNIYINGMGYMKAPE